MLAACEEIADFRVHFIFSSRVGLMFHTYNGIVTVLLIDLYYVLNFHDRRGPQNKNKLRTFRENPELGTSVKTRDLVGLQFVPRREVN